jgi:hypothetical protein
MHRRSPGADRIESKVRSCFAIRRRSLKATSASTPPGALQLIAVIALRQRLHASAGFGQVVLICADTQAGAPQLRHVLVNSISAGGGIVRAVLSREAA